MDRLTITQRIKMIRSYNKNGDSHTATYRALRGDYDLHNRSTTQAIGKSVKKFEEAGVVTTIEPSFRCSAENISIVSESFTEDPNVSNSPHSQELGLSYCTFWSISHLDLNLHPYKVQLMQQLTIPNIVDMWNWCLNNRRWTAIFGTKFFSAMNHISHSVGMLINKIVVFGILRIFK